MKSFFLSSTHLLISSYQNPSDRQYSHNQFHLRVLKTSSADTRSHNSFQLCEMAYRTSFVVQNPKILIRVNDYNEEELESYLRYFLLKLLNSLQTFAAHN